MSADTTIDLEAKLSRALREAIQTIMQNYDLSVNVMSEIVTPLLNPDNLYDLGEIAEAILRNPKMRLNKANRLALGGMMNAHAAYMISVNE